MKISSIWFTLMLIVACGDSAPAGIVYLESQSGDLGTPQAPSFLGSAGLGVNTVTGTLFNTQNARLDPDAFSFTIDAGLQLDSLFFSNLDGPGRHFFAFNDGPLSTDNGGGNLISTLIGVGDINTNILGGSLNSFRGSGLNGESLGPGTYQVWFQELNLANDHNYSITFTTSQVVPEPASASLLLVAGVAVLSLRRKTCLRCEF